MLTARDGEADIVAGLEIGADDYLTKPFSPRVLSARLQAVLRRWDVGEPQGERTSIARAASPSTTSGARRPSRASGST